MALCAILDQRGFPVLPWAPKHCILFDCPNNLRMRNMTRGSGPPSPNSETREGWAAIRTLLPYLLEYKWRVSIALLCLVGAKVANVTVPLIMKQIVDGLGIVLKSGPQQLAFGVIAGLLIAYGAARLSTTVFTELREFVFA